MFYTKYRPGKFSDLIGLASVTDNLVNQLKKGKFGHAYLFYGPRGTGKTTAARIFAKAVNCENLTDGEPCGECAACVSILAGRYMDIIEIDAASNRGIDDIRSLRDKIKLAPTSGEYKVYIIDEVHMLTIEAFNALLKTLEEPPKHAIFILATTEIQKVPETIKSRCQRFEFHRAGVKDIVKKLKLIADAEGASLSEEDLDHLARLAQGGFRDAETLLEQVLAGEAKLTGLLQLSPDGARKFLDSLLSGQTKEALILINEFYNQGQNLPELIRELLLLIRDLLLIKAGLGEVLVERPAEAIAELNQLAKKAEEKSLMKLVDLLQTALQTIRYSPIPQLPLELAVLEYAGEVVNSEKNGVMDSHGSQKEAIGGHESRKEIMDSHGSSEAFPSVQWGEILLAVKPLNHSLAALLQSAKPLSFDGTNLEIEVAYPFHLERLEERRNRDLFEGAVKQVLGEEIKVGFRLAEKKL